jgi:excisionase family DNA binding protein
MDQNTIIESLLRRTSYVSTTEALEILGLTRNTFCAWVRRGTLPALRIGNSYKLDPREFAAWLQERQTRKTSTEKRD